MVSTASDHLERPTSAVRPWSCERGVTLVELLIALAVVAILSAIAVPSYRSHVLKAERSDGQRALLRLALAQEVFRSRCAQYASTLAGAPGCNTDGSGAYSLGLFAISPEGHYSLDIASANEVGFTARATAIGAQAADTSAGVSCKVLVIDQDSGRTPTECW